ncbi:hypothetical protein ACF0H5_019116 [Mactra antiquata]
MGLGRTLGYLGLFFIPVASTLAGIACGITYWQSGDVNLAGFDVYINSGIWTVCTEIKQLNTQTCDSINFDDFPDDYETNVKAIRALVILGILNCTAANVFLALVLFVTKQMKIMFFVSAGCVFSAGLFFMISMAVFVEEVKTDTLDYAAAFYLIIIAWIMSWVGCGLVMGAKFTDKDE